MPAKPLKGLRKIGGVFSWFLEMDLFGDVLEESF